MPRVKPILPGSLINGRPATLGVMGGGQLGRMFVHAAQALGFETAVLDPDPQSPAGRVSHHHVQTGYVDAKGLAALAACCHAVTTEFENVPAAAMAYLATQLPVSPAAAALRIAQDRAQEKAQFKRSGVSCAPHAVLETSARMDALATDLLPGILKTTRMGYDGKGQIRVANQQELKAAWAQLKQVPCVLEKRLPLEFECSVIVARGSDGRCVNLPIQRNLHRDGILAITEVHARAVPPQIAKQAIQGAQAIAKALGYVGVLCVEFFVLQSGTPEQRKLGRLVVNEIAPRPHNSGHYSMDACDASQFELQVRTMAGMPLVQPRQHSPAIMLNLLGDLWPQGATPAWDKLLALPGTHLHLYGKAAPRPGRKMGHLNITGKTVDEVKNTARKACRILGIAPPAHWQPRT